jgi:very-short-patch-repair endonuclease
MNEDVQGGDEEVEVKTRPTDFFQGDVEGGLEKMRRRLLDLTKRNRLLNYRYSKKGALRVVDELPNELFAQLVDGKELFFKPVPRPSGWRQRDNELEPLPGFAQPTAVQHAESLDIRTSFELPLPGTSRDQSEARHLDRAIQTLHYPEELEGVLRSLHSAARLTIEETGTNMLYLAFGFLDWFESDESEQVATAPLILLPASLRRAEADPRTRAYRYGIQHSGEDILANISLQELLKQDFSLELPEFGEDDSPESYFGQLNPILIRYPRWKLRRHVTLTLLSFGKLLMYRDLDPKTWPRGKGPANHQRVREFFEGRQEKTVDFAEDYSLDSSSHLTRVPQLVDEADSSQHSALVDAVSGRNLVISGPPGTGKSQTITNLIAAAMAADKRVLFVSEKLAALEVVRHRLERLGLGTFCLELHSHKSKKRALLDDIDARIKQQGTFADPAKLDDKLQALEETKRELSAYAELVNRPFGALHQKLFDVIWSAARAKTAVGTLSPILASHRIKQTTSLTIHQIDVLHRLVAQYATHLDAAKPEGHSLREHPWYGVRNHTLTFRDEERVCESLVASCDSMDALIEAIQSANALVDADESWLEFSIRSLDAATKAVGTLSNPIGAVDEILPKLDRAGAPRRIAEFIAWLEAWERVRADLDIFGELPSYEIETVQKINSALNVVAEIAPQIPSVSEIASGIELIASALAKVEDGCSVFEECQPLVGSSVVPTDSTAVVLGSALHAVKNCPLDLLGLRHDGLTSGDASATLKKAAEESAAIKKRTADLDKTIDVALAPDAGQLREHIAATTETHWWSFLNSEHRRARRNYRAMSRSGSAPAERMRADFRELFAIRQAQSQVERNALYKRAAGQHSRGIDSPFAELQLLAEWWTKVERELSAQGKLGENVACYLWLASPEVVRAFATVERSNASRLRRLTAAHSLIGDVRERTGNPALSTLTWAELRTALDTLASRLTRTSQFLKSVRLPETVQIPMRAQLASGLLEQNGLRARIESAADVADLLEEGFHGTRTDLAGLRIAVSYHKSVSQAFISPILRRWLLQKGADDRLNRVRRSLADAQKRREGADKAWTRYRELAELRLEEWYAATQVVDQDLVALVKRGRDALANRRTLAGWLDYLHSVENLQHRELGYLVELAENEKLSSAMLTQALEYVRANSLLEEAFQAHPQLERFSGLSHEQVRTRYAALDKECIKLYRRRAAAKAGGRHVPNGVGYGPAAAYTELSLITREIAKQKRHIPLRQLMRRAGGALQALKPCFMMGPLSVAQYLSPGAIQFDLLIVDEASQLRPQDALGAVARAGQIVIVGDQMQLPPTSFFERLGDDDDDQDEERTAIEDSESILDVASSLYRPARMLKWHYRSRHGSLIAFSNKEFYNNELVVFPSPFPKSKTLGVKFVHVQDGVFESRRNRIEAQRIVASAVRHMEQRADETLGIVAMNAPQRELLEDLLEQQLKTHPAVESFVRESENGLEPVFVKNLENVQGDERDVIYISATYAKGPDGPLHLRFGPILGHTGHRRLNVLFTRARKRVVLFSSMKSEDIKIQPGSSWGLKALKGYLAYAETGILETAKFTGLDPDSDFEIEVAAALRDHGIDAVAQVGVAGYFLDLAVKHPDKTDAFILGIECDGATYHSSRSARDRDRLRQSVLEDLGWNIHRVWSTDWFKQREREVERILTRIENIRRQSIPESAIDAEWLSESATAAAPDLLIADNGWLSEEEAQPLSDRQALDQLVLLRDEIAVADPSINAADSILRPEMVALLIKGKPKTHEDWQRNVSLEARLSTNGDHVRHYLGRVLEVTSQLLR